MIKVVHFIETLFQGGAETLVKDYALLLDKTKFDITILCIRRTDSPYETLLTTAGIKIIFVSDFFGSTKKISGRLANKIAKESGLYHLKIKKILNQLHPDIIHAHLSTLRYLKFASTPFSTKLFYTVHGEPARYWDSSNPISQKERKACSTLIQKHHMTLIALHDKMQKDLNHRFAVQNTITLNNGINFNRFIVQETREEIRKSLNIPEKCFLIGHVGRFIKEKNHSTIINTFSELHKKNINTHLLLVGSGELKELTINKINSLGLTQSVTILNSRTDIQRIMKSMDIFIFPSTSEGLGIVLIEAQKMGIPCVISSAIPEAAIVSNLVHRMSPNATDKEWAEQLQNFKVDSIKYNGIENWDMNIVIKKLEYIYQQAVSSNTNMIQQ